MEILTLDDAELEEIHRYASQGAWSLKLGSSTGPAHVYWLRFAEGGEIGLHPTGFRQLFVPLTGKGWVSGDALARQEIRPGQVAVFAQGEQHAKGAGDPGMTALMVQLGA